ncbi:MAG: exostosin family protein, partial [Bacteroidota bacterium]
NYIQNMLVQSPAFRSQSKISENMVFRQVFGRWVRKNTAEILRRDKGLEFHYIGNKRAFFEMSKEEQKQARINYLNNLKSVPYRLIMRGDENSAFSLYEAMSAGRIPVIVHTGMRLPLIDGIKWEDFAIIHPFERLSSLTARIKAIHRDLSNEEFKERCKLSRKAFEALSPESFFRQVILPLLKTLNYQSTYKIPISLLA